MSETYKPDCAAMVYRKGWPDCCRNKAVVMGTFTAEDGATHRLGYCKRHAAEIKRRGEAETRNHRIQPRYPHIAHGTFTPDTE